MSAIGKAIVVLSLLRAAVRCGDSERERALVPAALRVLGEARIDRASVKVLQWSLRRAMRDGSKIATVEAWDALDDVVELALEQVSIDDEPTYVPDGEEAPASDTEPCPPSEEMACWASSLPPESDVPRDSGSVPLTLRAPSSTLMHCGEPIDVMA